MQRSKLSLSIPGVASCSSPLFHLSSTHTHIHTHTYTCDFCLRKTGVISGNSCCIHLLVLFISFWSDERFLVVIQALNAEHIFSSCYKVKFHEFHKICSLVGYLLNLSAHLHHCMLYIFCFFCSEI